jgi:chromosomal replication initiator protein
VNNSSIESNLTELWRQICEELRQVVSADAVERWFLKLKPVSLSNNMLTLSAENSIYEYWIEENYLSQLTGVVSRLLEAPTKIRFNTVAEIPAETPARSVKSRQEPSREKEGASERKSGLNPRNVFEAFVVGTSNQFAHAAAMAVAEAPARTYNPLFLHGRVGLGKTHLMQAIGHLIQKNKKHLKVLYVTSEQFANEFINAIQYNELAKFRKIYRQVDVLLIDDVQFLAGKERCQEEFFHTFNSLFDGNKQVVLTSDSPPNEIVNLEKRLTSRFEWGLTAELQMPDLETRLAIIRHKLSTMSAQLNEDVQYFIAEHVKSNIRRLEGALNRAAVYATLHGKGITVSQAEVLLRDLLQYEGQQAVTIDNIQRKVAETYDIRLADMTSKRRPANIALPRMVAMYLSRKLTSCSLSEIGDAFGGRDHGTVLHAQRTIEEKIKEDQKLRQVVAYLSEKLGRPEAVN